MPKSGFIQRWIEYIPLEKKEEFVKDVQFILSILLNDILTRREKECPQYQETH